MALVEIDMCVHYHVFCLLVLGLGLGLRLLLLLLLLLLFDTVFFCSRTMDLRAEPEPCNLELSSKHCCTILGCPHQSLEGNMSRT